jgi:hypothetical protein
MSAPFIFVDEPGHRVGVVQVHPDAASMDFHMTVITKHLAGAWDWIDQVESQHAFGTPSAALTVTVREHSEPLTAFPIHVAGFTRASVR